MNQIIFSPHVTRVLTGVLWERTVISTPCTSFSGGWSKPVSWSMSNSGGWSVSVSRTSLGYQYYSNSGSRI